MNYIERCFKRKEKTLIKNGSQKNLRKSPSLQEAPKKKTNMNSSIEPNKDSDIVSKDDKNRNIHPKDELEKFKQQQYEIRINNLKLKRFSMVYSKKNFILITKKKAIFMKEISRKYISFK